MPICSKCKSDKKETDFGFKNKAENKRHPVCKECVRKYTKQHYKNNSVVYKKRARDNTAIYTKRNRTNAIKYLLSHPCVDCGEADPVVLQFDHRNPKEKVERVSKMIVTPMAWETVYKEIQKCDIRCANCHFRKHAKEDGSFKMSFMNDLMAS